MSLERLLRAWWRGRYGRALVFEVLVLASLLAFYRFGRYLGRNQVERAFDHARDILEWQRWLPLPTERSVQALALDHLSSVHFLNRYYAVVHFPATVAFLVIAYVRSQALYRRVRAVIVSVTAVALVVQVAWPLAPPRMLHGFVDTIAVYGPQIYERPGVAEVANQYAAMPSLHVGWALVVAYGAWQLGRVGRALGIVHATITIVAVVATANHYWADVALAAAMVAVAAVVTERVVSGSPAAAPAPGPIGAAAGR